MSETAPQGEIILYQTDDGRVRLRRRFEDELASALHGLLSEEIKLPEERAKK